MNDRIAKKHARQFLDGKREYPVKVEWFSPFTEGRVRKVVYKLPVKVWREVDRLAFRRGWDGFYWSAPTLLAVVDKDGELCPPVGGWGEEKLSIAAKVLAKGWQKR